MDALSVCLQVLASKKWLMSIADVEGAFPRGTHATEGPETLREVT